MPNLRTIVAVAVPVLTAFIGLLWFFSKKKPKNDEPSDSKIKQKGQNVSKTNNGSVCATESKQGGSSDASVGSQVEKKQVKEILKTSSKPDVACLLMNTPVGSRNSVFTDFNEQETFVDAHNLPEHVNRSVVIREVINASNNSCDSDEFDKVEVEKEDIDKDSFITASETRPSGRSTVQSSPKLEEPNRVSPLLHQNSVPNDRQPYISNVNNNAEIVSTIFIHERKVEDNSNQFPDGGCDQNENKSQLVHVELPSEKNLCECDISVKVTKNGPKMAEKHLDDVHSQKNENSHVNNDHGDKLMHTKMTESRNILNNLMQKESTEIQSNNHKPTENNHNHLDSSNCDNLSEVSNDSGKGGSVDNAHPLLNDEERQFEFNIPSDMCGLFIGTRGKTIKTICKESGTQIRLNNNPYTRDYQICVIEGTKSAIDRACGIIKKKFPSLQFTATDTTNSSVNTVIMPDIMQLSLPEGVTVDVVVSSIVDAGRIFVQQPTHPTFLSLEKLHMFMNQCYMQDGCVPDIPRPIELGVICAAPMLGGWYRAQIMATYETTDESYIKYVDYGGYTRISSTCLKQIRSDFMTLPFEAIECYLANITPLSSELYFSVEAAAVLEELTHGKLLHAQIVGRAEDGIPYVHLYQIHASNIVVFVNREMVNRGVVQWLEVMT